MALTEQGLRNAFHASGRNWDQLCQAMVYGAARFTHGAVRPYPSAIDAYHHSAIESKTASKAPAGAVHYWAIGKYGHVGVALGGGRVAMGSKYIDTSWGINVGVTTVSKYTLRTGARYLGWARTNGVNRINIEAPAKAPHPSAGRKYLNANSGEGLSAIASRAGISLDKIKALNPAINGPQYIVKLGQRVWTS